MSKPDVTFVNAISVQGFLNGVVNLSLVTTRFVPTPHEDGKVHVKLEYDTTVDLRCDLHCAMEIRDALDRIIAENTKPQVSN